MLAYNTFSLDIASLLGRFRDFLPSRVAKHHRSVIEALVSVPGRDVIRLPGLAYASIESCRMDWRPANGKIVVVPWRWKFCQLMSRKWRTLPYCYRKCRFNSRCQLCRSSSC